MNYISVSFISIIILISIFQPPLLVKSQQQTDSCSSNLNLKDLSFDATLLQCLPVWSDQDFILRYGETSSNLWSFVLSAPDSNRWMAMGFSISGGMIGSSAVVGWLSSDGSNTGVKQYHLTGKSPDQVIPDEGDLVLVTNSSKMVSQSSRFYLVFQLNSVSPPRSKIIYAAGPIGVLPSSPGYTLSEHSFIVQTSLDFVTGTQKVSKSRPFTRLRKSHGALNMISWGILVIIGVLIARYFRQHDPTWFYAHIAVQSTALILGIIGIICGFALEDRIKANNVSVHKGIGIFILALGCLQAMALLLRPDKSSSKRQYWNWYHHTVGRVMIVFAIANVFFGINLGKEGAAWKLGYSFALIVLFVIAIVLEIRLWKRR